MLQIHPQIKQFGLLCILYLNPLTILTAKEELSSWIDSLLFQIQGEQNSLLCGGELLILSQLSSTLSHHLGN